MDQDGPFGPVVNGTQIVLYEYRPNKPAAICFISPRWLTKIYVLIDIGCICSQFIGALIPVSGDPDSVKTGEIILIAGLVTQLSALSIFILASWHIYRRITQDTGKFLDSSSIRWRRYFRAIEVVTVVMIVRSVGRSIEFPTESWRSQLPRGTNESIFVYECEYYPPLHTWIKGRHVRQHRRQVKHVPKRTKPPEVPT